MRRHLGPLRRYCRQLELVDGSTYSARVRGDSTVRRTDGESGASLILALVFLIVVGLIVISIAGLTTTDLKVTSAFAASQSTTAAADGAANVAIQYARYNFDAATLNQPAPCNSPQDINLTVQAWCETQWRPGSASTRFVTVSVCLPTVASTGVDCARNPLLQAIVVIDDYPTSNSNLSCVPGTTQSTLGSTCGSQMILNSWAFNVVPPVVQSIVPAQASCSATAITITGSNFTPQSKVTFVSATASGLASNDVLSATNVTVANSYSISATSPTFPTGSSGQFYVVVTGLTGPSVPTSSTPSWTWSC